MVVDALATYAEWKQNFLAEIDALPHAVAKGDEFVIQVLQAYYSLSEDDAINATDCAGAGDHGIDAVYVLPEEQDANPQEVIPRIRVVQGKYGTAGSGLKVYQEAKKFTEALKLARDGKSVTDAVDKVAGVLKNNGQVYYVIATVEPLDKAQQQELEDIKKLANSDFGDSLIIEAISLDNIYSVLSVETKAAMVNLSCKYVTIENDAYLGVVRLTDMYMMLVDYKNQNGGAIDSIYDHNIRKYIRRNASAVNRQIFKTLESHPERFIAYNNGITITCHMGLPMETGLRLQDPQIVNGCQTTRTLYEFMDKNFAGISPLHDPGNKLAAYREAFMAVKVLVAQNDKAGIEYAKDITRFSNKQNVIRGKDFIALEDMYRDLKNELLKRGYFLETQKGEYASLTKVQHKKYPKETHVIDSFEATLFYVAGILGKPQEAFGHSGDFAPGGQKFESFVNRLTADSLFVPWLVAQQAQEMGYTKIKSKHEPVPGTEHREQTRHLFQYMFFRMVREMVANAGKKKAGEVNESEMYTVLKSLMADYDQDKQQKHPFYQLLSLADDAIATFMELAKEDWYVDRNAFLKGQELMQENHLIMAIKPVMVRMTKMKLGEQVIQIVGK